MRKPCTIKKGKRSTKDAALTVESMATEGVNAGKG
jgi:hypothetical protein